VAAGVLAVVAIVVGSVALTARRPSPSPASQAQASTTVEQTQMAVATQASTSTPPTIAASTTAATPARTGGTSGKKGVSTWDFSGVGAALVDVGVHWYWNWAAVPTKGAGTAAEFVPMIWGPGAVTADTIARARQNGTTLLGFNEPDFASQANMSVDQALDLWPQLQATGMRLGSPAPATGAADAGGWLDRFLSGAAQRGYRVDFIALHWYGSDFSAAAVNQLRGYLQAVWDRYHLPIWLTEFALIKFTSSGSVYPTDSQQASFINGATAMLESLSFVERYAWFALPTSDSGDATGLYRDGATPTAAGVAYRAAGA